MHLNTTRRGFIGIGSAGVLAGVGGAFGVLQQAASQSRASPPPAAPSEAKPAAARERPAALNPEDVQAVVGAAHRDIDKVRALLDAQPALVNATWDWGSGDFETALGAAGHTGRVEIAELVISRGARLELHAAAMLGWMEMVKAAVAAQSGAENILGPHAIPMHSHARAGGERAADVLAYLESLNCLRDMPVDDEQRGRCAGEYRVEGSDDVLVVINANRRLMLQPPVNTGRRAWYMLNQGDGLFRPADALYEQVTFEMNADGSQVKAMKIDDGDVQVVALRVS